MGKSYIVHVAPFSEELACPRDFVAHGHGQVRDLEEIMKGKGIDLAATVYSHLAASRYSYPPTILSMSWGLHNPKSMTWGTNKGGIRRSCYAK